MPPNTIPLNIFAQERARVPLGSSLTPRPLHNISYDVPILPRTPLRIGLLVHVIEIKRDRPQTGDAEDDDQDNDPPHYIASATRVTGRITGFRTLERKTTELIVTNDDTTTKIAYAYLTIHHEKGKTVNLPLGLRVLRAVASAVLPATRDVPIEENAVIVAAPTNAPETWTPNGPVAIIPTAEEWLRARRA